MSTTLPTGTLQNRNRYPSVDIIRGLAIVLMALDHARDFWSPTGFAPEDLSHSSVFLFFTRWITHFCAPTFVFLSGASAYFQLAKLGGGTDAKRAVSRFLLTRGLWLIVLDICVIYPSWSGQPPYPFFLVQVFWALGWSMLLLGLFIWLPDTLIALLALLMVAGHDSLNGIQVTHLPWLWTLLHRQEILPLFDGAMRMFVLYPLIPWPGVMMLGYLLGKFFVTSPLPRRQALLAIGLALWGMFILLRAVVGYGDMQPFVAQPNPAFSVLAFLNVSKYPPSLQYLCVTLGACFLLLALVDGRKNKLTDALQVFGQVPMFFYLVHVPLLHLSAHLWLVTSFGSDATLGRGPKNWPPGYAPDLLRAYLAWAVLVIGLYFLCKWYGKFKQARPAQWWWRYI